MMDDLILRTPNLKDIDFMLQLENDPEIWKVSQTKTPFSRDEIAAFISENKHDLYTENQLRNIIVLKSNNTPIGTLDLFSFDKTKNTAGIGISILKEWRGKKYASKALELFIKKSFSEFNLQELFCTIFTDNHISISLFESKGFVRAGILNNNVHYQGQAFDVYLYRLKK